jgi:two-component system heavy metal sensor histidine kinase CusS
LLASRLTYGLDQLNAALFKQIEAKLVDRAEAIDSATLEERLRETSEFSSALFYISIENPGTGVKFLSRNLQGNDIPDVIGERAYFAYVNGVGEMRANEFLLPPLDITIATPTLALRASLSAYVTVCALLLAAMLLASAAIGTALSGLVLRPLRVISETANRIRFDNLGERIPVGNVRDEMSELAVLLNQMFERMQIAFDQIRRFSDEASHELKTPLSLIRLHAEKLLVDGELSSGHTEAVLVLLEEVARLNLIIDELLFLSRAEAHAVAFNIQQQDPTPFLESFSQDAIVLAEHYHCRFESRLNGSGLAEFEEKWMRQVLLNILTNAVNVSPRNGLIVLDSSITEHSWRVAVEDEGPGLTAEQRQRMFDRFVRYHVPESGDRGCGLGLAICKKIVELHKGAIYAEQASNGRGLRVVFELPAFRSVKHEQPLRVG